MTVYADSLFLINLTALYIQLTAVEKICRVKMNAKNKIIAAVLGAIAAAVIFCNDYKSSLHIPQMLNMLAIISFAYYGHRPVLIKAIPSFAVISQLCAGIISFLSGIWGADAVIKNGITYIDINEAVFIMFFACTYPVILLLTKLLCCIKERKLYTLSVVYKGKTAFLSSLYDSGNLLSDNGKSVIIAQWDTVKPLLDIDCYDTLYELMSKLSLKLVTLSTISGTKTVIIFYADKVYIKENNTVFENIPIGILNGSISKNNTYNSLISKEYI